MHTDDTHDRQHARDTTYQAAYHAWFASLAPEEQEQLRAKGLNTPSLHPCGTAPPERDAAESSVMSEGSDPALLPVPEPPPVAQQHDAEQVWEILRRVFGELLARRNARLTIECLALASGLSYTGDSMAEIARRHGVTRAAVSKCCVDLTENIGLEPSRAMQSRSRRKIARRSRIHTLDSHE